MTDGAAAHGRSRFAGPSAAHFGTRAILFGPMINLCRRVRALVAHAVRNDMMLSRPA